jgi:hypothetical protein
MSLVRKAGGKIFRMLKGVRSPLPKVINHSDYKSLLKMPRFTPGRGTLFDRPVAFADIDGYLHSVSEIFGDEVYRFQCQTVAPHIIDAGANIGLSVIYFDRGLRTRSPDVRIAHPKYRHLYRDDAPPGGGLDRGH